MLGINHQAIMRDVRAAIAWRELEDAQREGDAAVVQSRFADLVKAIDTLAGRKVTLTTGHNAIAGLVLLAGQTVEVPVIFDVPAPSSSYQPVAIPDAPNIGQIQVVGCTKLSPRGCTVVLKNVSLLSLTLTIGATVLAIRPM